MDWKRMPRKSGEKNRGHLFLDTPVGRYSIRPQRTHGEYRAYLNGMPTSYFGTQAQCRDAVERAMRQRIMQQRDKPQAADAVALLKAALRAVEPPPWWLQEVQEVTGGVNLLAEGRVFEVRVR